MMQYESFLYIRLQLPVTREFATYENVFKVHQSCQQTGTGTEGF